MPRGKKPSRDEILEGIRKAWKRGDDLRYSGVTRGKNRWLERSGRHYFSDWNEMLEEVGLSQEIVKQKVEGPRRKKRKQKLLADLAKAYADGIDLSGSAIQAKGNPNRGLRDRAKYAFSGRFFWHNALRAAKLPVEEIIRQRLWDKEKVNLIAQCLFDLFFIDGHDAPCFRKVE